MFLNKPVHAQTVIYSGWLEYPVTFDGKLTSAEEWSDTTPVDLTLIGDIIPENTSARIWMKNDHTWL
jgi:hypothetical protein